MKLKDGLVLREIAGQFLITPIGRLSQICHLLHISRSAAFIWKIMQKGEFTEDFLVEQALKKYKDVTENILRRDIHNFIKLLDDNYMLESGKVEPIIGVAKVEIPKDKK